VRAKQAEAAFDQVIAAVRSHLAKDEYFTIEMWGEESQFTRFNQARVRQTGTVIDGQLQLSLMTQQRTGFYKLPFTGDASTDVQQALAALAELREAVLQLPIDPYLVLPAGNATSREIHLGQLLTADQVIDAILPEVKNLDFTGIYAGGLLLQAYADSAGQHHWFTTESFSLDYSIFTPDGQAVKGTFAGSHWDQNAYLIKLADARVQLDRLTQPPKSIPKGQYRTYLAPAAVADLTAHLSWNGVSEASMQQGESSLLLLQREERQFSSAVTLKENFQRGLVPRFNEIGEIAPIELPIIVAGKLVNTLVSSRTAKEYGKTANGASSDECLRSPEIAPGSLPPEAILKRLDRGLYLSNLHYLNWSDRPTARMTGMTRYACFWVENGEIVAPIENLRFDESLYCCLGENLIALTDFQEFIPDVDTYDRRSLGGIWTPGMLVEDFTYTL
jgi:predicted Zn-dependent protease